MPVLFEFFLDSTLGDGELRGCGFFVFFLLYALGRQGLSANGGPGVSVPAALCSGASCSGSVEHGDGLAPSRERR